YYSYATDLNASNGQICYVRKELSHSCFRLLAHNASLQYEYTGMTQNKCVELSLFEFVCRKHDLDFKKIYLHNLYKHPKYENEMFLVDLNKFISKYYTNSTNCSLIVMGDFNIDFNQASNKKYLHFFKQQFNLEPYFDKCKTHKNISQLDWCFYNKHNHIFATAANLNAGFHSQPYTTWFSDHSAIFSEITF
ncbi:hypothetical protein BpHYR1_004081, partial [Brachionus plicatilis]